MLPDIARPNKLLHVSGLGQYAGTLLTRSATDMHPEDFHGDVVWSGTIEAQRQKAWQRPPDPPTVRVEAEAHVVVGSTADRILDVFLSASEPLCVRQVADAAGVQMHIAASWLRLLNKSGLLVSAEFENPLAGKHGQRAYTRMYAAAKAKAA